jgi:predicted protein tyrosine phosphatase
MDGVKSVKQKILFVCDFNRMRSPTAETIFGHYPQWEVKSAGISPEADVPLTRELLEWADVIFVMEKRHRNVIRKKFPGIYQEKRIICLYIPDEFEYMDPELVGLLNARLRRYLL